jgi:hypothetical protein
VDTTGTLEAVVPDHPIFQGGVLDAMNQVDMWDEVKYGGADNIDLLDAADIGNGTRLAVDPGTNLLWAAYWDAGVEFYPGSGQFAGGRRLYLSGGSDDDPVSWGGKNYTPQADQILLNAIEFMAVPSGLNPGDFNSDGAIDLADFGVLANNFGTGNTFEQGDNNRDGRVDLRDFVQFVDLFNAAQGGAGAAAVPEPNSLVLVSLGTLLMASIPRRRKRSRESFRS